MLRLVRFSGMEEFLAAAKENSLYFSQCVRCEKIFFANGIPSDKTAMLNSILDEFNNVCLDRNELELVDIQFSHGACRVCMRTRMRKLARKRQADQKYRSCFGTAMHGHCSEDGKNGRPKCIYYIACVLTKKEIQDWASWIRYRNGIVRSQHFSLMLEEIIARKMALARSRMRPLGSEFQVCAFGD